MTAGPIALARNGGPGFGRAPVGPGARNIVRGRGRRNWVRTGYLLFAQCFRAVCGGSGKVQMPEFVADERNAEAPTPESPVGGRATV